MIAYVRLQHGDTTLAGGGHHVGLRFLFADQHVDILHAGEGIGQIAAHLVAAHQHDDLVRLADDLGFDAGLISYLPERTYLSGWMNVVQLLDFFGDFYPDFDRDAAEHMLSALDVSPRLRIKQMSKGTREKVQLILVMSRRARLYLLDEPIGGVDPATRDYIIHTILTNYNENASLVISTHLIADVENVLDDVIFINKGRVLLQQSVDQIRQEKGCSVDELFREVFRYAE